VTSLRDLGCELGQGFLFAKPMSSTALAEFLGTADAASAERELESPPASNAA